MKPMKNQAPLGNHVLLILALQALGGWAPALTLDFDQRKGEQVVDASTGALSAPAKSPLWSSGVKGQGAYFMGNTEEYFQFAHGDSLDARETLAIQVWLWPGRFGDHQGIVFKGDRSASPEKVQYKLTIRPEGRVEFGYKNVKGDWIQLISSEAIPLRKWTRVTATFDRGLGSIHFDGRAMAAGPMTSEVAGAESGSPSLPGNRAPVEIGRMQGKRAIPDYPFIGAMDELVISKEALPAPTSVQAPPPGDPLASLLLFDREIAVADLAATPVLAGLLSGTGEWIFEVRSKDREGLVMTRPGVTAADQSFRYLLDDFCGPWDLGEKGALRCRGIRRSLSSTLAVKKAAFTRGDQTIPVTVDPSRTRQTLTGFAAYANAPRVFLTDAADRKRVYGPVLAEMHELGVAQLDFAFGSLSAVEPKNDNGDPTAMDMDAFREAFKKNAEVQSLVAFLKYLKTEGFTFGIRSTSFAPWQVEGDEASGTARHRVDEIAECWVAVLRLLQEDGLTPTHLIPVWEPAYHPDTVAAICATTTRLAVTHGFTLPIVGPYVLATGGQSTVMTSMPDRYETGAAYTRAYLKAMPDAPVIGLEDYASGAAMVAPNLKRLWDEVIDPLSKGKSREMWMIEYGAPCGTGPWNFFPSRWHGPLSTWESAFRLARDLHQLMDSGVSRYFFWKAWDSIGEVGMSTPSSWGLLKGTLHDEERRPPFYTARQFWKYLPPGSRVVSAEARDLQANAAVEGKRIVVTLVNPRSQAVTAAVRVKDTALAPQARLTTATETVQGTEMEIYSRDQNGFDVVLPPRSVSTLVCRKSGSQVRFDESRWAPADPGIAHLSDLDWISSSTTKGVSRAFGVNGMDVNWRRDETWTGEWLILGQVRYRKGLSVFGKGEISFAIPAGCTRFEALVGVDDGSEEKVPARFDVKLDGKTAFPGCERVRGDKPETISIPIHGQKTITLLVDNPGKKVGADWLESRFILESPGAR